MTILKSPLWGLLLLAVLMLSAPMLQAQDRSALIGHWVINERLSDSTDKEVAKALREMGQKVRASWFSRNKEQFRGGPAEQELYDRMSYDKVLTIRQEGDTWLFTYADDFQRYVYTDNRRRSVSLTGLDAVEDFSFAHWENESLLVEARPRDGGYADETYTLIKGGTQLQLKLHIKPRTFTTAIELTRIFDRQP